MAAPTSNGGSKRDTAASTIGGISTRAVILLLVLNNLLVYQLATLNSLQSIGTVSNAAASETQAQAEAKTQIRSVVNETVASSSNNQRYALEIPAGEAQALPSVRISDEENEKVNREIYGGKGDKKHLGGFTEVDVMGLSPSLWKDMVAYFGIKSVLDVGCGRGISTSWFVLHGLDTLCVEGSHDAVERTMLPDPSIITEHDFSRGPWWPNRTVDAIWSVELLEHIGRNYQQNYIAAFRKAALIFVTSSRWGGWHHVEVHWDDWWIARFQQYGFVYSEALTKRARDKASEDRGKGQIDFGKDEPQKFNPQHLYLSMKVFINPAVASLPEHQHLFAEQGCYKGRAEGGKMIHRECGTGKEGEKETPLPKEFRPLELTEEMDQAWLDHVKKNVNPAAVA